jgi:hypothetical protein
MKQIQRIEQLANSITEIDCNGLRVENALVHLELKREDFEEFVEEWINRIDPGLVGHDGTFGLSFNGIDFSITKKRY